MTVAVRVLGPSEAAARRDALAAILVDCVRGGASVSFMLPFGPDEARSYWDRIVASVAAGQTVLLAAFVDDALRGTAQLDLDTPPNQPHRAEVRKVLVAPDARREGIGAALMAACEREALARGRTLLTLDTVTGAAGDRLYARTGWTRAGTIPGFALFPDGASCDATIFFKVLPAS